MGYEILTSYFNKYGVNDGTLYQIVDDRMRTVATTENKKTAERYLRDYNKEPKQISVRSSTRARSYRRRKPRRR